MKANEAPKKIQLGFIENENHSLKIRGISYLEETQDGLIEYIRTDAFIEKACDAYCAICDTKECAGCVECAWVIKFRRQLLKY